MSLEFYGITKEILDKLSYQSNLGKSLKNTLRKFEKEESLSKHFLPCWKEQHPSHVSKSAPRSENIETRQVNEDIMNFFNSFKG